MKTTQSNEFLITFKKPFIFEQVEHKDVDLSGIENLTTGDLIRADGQFGEIGQFAVMNEMTTGYACIVAAQATNKPVEFFQQLPAVEGVKLKRIVMGFFNS
ncbi:hypothetical protein MKZ20_17520 [Psychrobacillus sp. FSL K6-2684]|uniref:hypothetical protein n=1 Tax=Psychrobacillus sp. FSL K6-2684 TaxID=2921547 RepID=UPI0030FA4B23